jgi:putative membrane protein
MSARRRFLPISLGPTSILIMTDRMPTADNSFSQEEAILRDRLALDRTRLANERTLLAYVRTAFMLVIAGATALKLFTETPTVVFTAWLFIGLGVLVAIIGAWRFDTMRRSINRRQQ